MKLSIALCAVAATADQADLLRARRTVPRAHVAGSDHAEIRGKLNGALRQGSLAMPRPTACEAFSLEELAELEEAFFELRSPELFTSDLRAPKHASLEALRAELARELRYLEAHPAVAEALRDGRCAELAMQWAHQLPAEARKLMGHRRLPLLPAKGTREHAPTLIQGGHYEVAKQLASKVTCQIGHDAKAVERGTWEGFPAWPYEVSYNASGYGPYPFWTLGGGSGGSLTGEGAPIYTRWSAVLNAERLEHAQCSTSALFGEDKPCTHLFLGSEVAYLFTQDESHCCRSSYPEYTCHLTAMQRDFYKVFQNQEILDDYVGEHGYYSGQVKKYSMHLTTPSNFWFWYVTDMNDRPIEQGEGPCDMYSSSGDRNCNGPPKMLFHQYDTESFSEATLEPEVFAIPEVCKNTKQDCVVQPTRFCGDVASTVAV